MVGKCLGREISGGEMSGREMSGRKTSWNRDFLHPPTYYDLDTEFGKMVSCLVVCYLTGIYIEKHFCCKQWKKNLYLLLYFDTYFSTQNSS